MPKSFYIVLSLIHQSNPRIIDRPWFVSLETATKIYFHWHHVSFTVVYKNLFEYLVNQSWKKWMAKKKNKQYFLHRSIYTITQCRHGKGVTHYWPLKEEMLNMHTSVNHHYLSLFSVWMPRPMVVNTVSGSWLLPATKWRGSFIKVSNAPPFQLRRIIHFTLAQQSPVFCNQTKIQC